jgi:uncharacterized protein (DUF2336 family)
MTGSVAVALGPELQAPPDRHRETLVRRFADLLFLPTERASPFEKGLVDEILSRLYPSLDPSMQQKLARRLSELADPPRRVTRLMAADRPEIAQLFLERVELFDEAELVALIAATGFAHHAMIARRASLSRAVTEALIVTRHPEIIETLLTHRGAVFSADVYRMLELSRGDAAYQELLLMRADLPASLAHEMFWWVGAPLRRAILQRYSMERRLLVEAVRDLELTLSAAPADVYWAFRFSGASRPRLRVQDDEMEALAHWLGGAPEDCFAATLAEALAIDAATVERIRRDEGGEALTVLLKALGLSASQFKSLGPRIAARLGALDPARPAALCALFETLSTDWADLVLRLWDQQGAGRA